MQSINQHRTEHTQSKSGNPICPSLSDAFLSPHCEKHKKEDQEKNPKPSNGHSPFGRISATSLLCFLDRQKKPAKWLLQGKEEEWSDPWSWSGRGCETLWPKAEGNKP
jgi:hypothetical protein